MVVDAYGIVHVAWYRGSNPAADVYYSRSLNGTAFSPPLDLSDQAAVNYAPRLASDSNGRVHITYTVWSGTPCRTASIYYRAPDDGVNFSPPVNVSGTTVEGHEHYESQIAVDESGGVNVVWKYWNNIDSHGGVFL